MAASFVVTGGAGFIGSHVVDRLVERGDTVAVVDDLTTGDEGRVHPDATLNRVSITDVQALDEVVDAAEPTAIIHLGAQSMVTVSVDDPGRDCAVNVQGTLNVLQAAKRHGASVVFTSTGGALYGNEATIPTPEDSLPAPLAPYGASKWAGEAYVNTWSAFTGVPHAVCRLGNVYGPRQNPHGEAGVVAIFTRHLYDDEAPRMFGHGKATRDYIHVDDVVSALLSAVGKRGTYNVATGIETSVADLWATLRAAAGKDLEARLEPLREGELERSCMSPARAQRELGFTAQVGLQDGLVATYHALVEQFARGTAR
jgi:UDP-glucose 4-epimerase